MLIWNKFPQAGVVKEDSLVSRCYLGLLDGASRSWGVEYTQLVGQQLDLALLDFVGNDIIVVAGSAVHLGRVFPHARLEPGGVRAVGAQVRRDLHVTHQVAQQGLTKLELFSTLGTLQTNTSDVTSDLFDRYSFATLTRN